MLQCIVALRSRAGGRQSPQLSVKSGHGFLRMNLPSIPRLGGGSTPQEKISNGFSVEISRGGIHTERLKRRYYNTIPSVENRRILTRILRRLENGGAL
jgi:hypothetical protein